MLRLYRLLVRPHLEYCMQAWHPHLQTEVDLLKAVQKRFTRMIPELRGQDYSVRLKRLNLTTLETRHLGKDLTEVFNIGVCDFLIINEHTSAGHLYKIFKQR